MNEIVVWLYYTCYELFLEKGNNFSMSILDKLQTFIILFTVGLCLLLGQVNIIEQYAEHLITPFLLLMLYGLFLTIPLQQFKKIFQILNF